ncbi:hypothetical protein VP01_1337g2 [Puccinia sorghi]|uniref:Tet-like 2OG-Fe(II) oxygenase domain-containing protein n=1 Tax=Puccinia sorghi TaxID=27349 RepID=A0A0L6VP38_9BASI|nr:hypothetical protein VP01_1337g2 [Puccinia sorghi]
MKQAARGLPSFSSPPPLSAGTKGDSLLAGLLPSLSWFPTTKAFPWFPTTKAFPWFPTTKSGCLPTLPAPSAAWGLPAPLPSCPQMSSEEEGGEGGEAEGVIARPLTNQKIIHHQYKAKFWKEKCLKANLNLSVVYPFSTMDPSLKSQYQHLSQHLISQATYQTPNTSNGPQDYGKMYSIGWQEGYESSSKIGTTGIAAKDIDLVWTFLYFSL